MKKIFFTILLAPVFLLFFALQASASDLLISNPEQVISIDPNGAGHFTLFVQNNTKENLILETKIKSFKTVGDKGNIELFDDSDNILINSWLKQQTNYSFKLRPGQKHEAVFLMSVSSSAKNKGYYASIYFAGYQQNDITKKIESNKSRILLGVESENNNLLLRSGKIEELFSPKFVFYGPVKFRLQFANNGKIHYQTNGQIEIYNSFDKKIASIQLKEKNILPDSLLSFYGILERKFLFGKYLVVAKMFDGDGNLTMESKEFFAFPWKEFLEFFVIVGLIIIAKKLKVKKIKFE
ncbi:MAG: hypothetical protein U9O55_01700 [Patescibacteria group bacterium]|nr:hypothetical protein [Patescibacteria group bacterium]